MFDKYSNNDTISVLHCLVSKIQQYQGIGMDLYLFWNYHTLTLLSTPKNAISSSYILMSKKMPKDKEFLEDFNKKYDALCQGDVIVDHEQQRNYEFATHIDRIRRHAIIIFKGPKHAFVLELYYQRFKGSFYNCPNIRYISDKELKEMHLSYNTIDISADELVRVAIETVSKMGDYNLLSNNCQNFVQNYLRDLGVEDQLGQLDGEIVRYYLDCISNFIYYLGRLFRSVWRSISVLVRWGTTRNKGTNYLHDLGVEDHLGQLDGEIVKYYFFCAALLVGSIYIISSFVGQFTLGIEGINLLNIFYARWRILILVRQFTPKDEGTNSALRGIPFDDPLTARISPFKCEDLLVGTWTGRDTLPGLFRWSDGSVCITAVWFRSDLQLERNWSEVLAKVDSQPGIWLLESYWLAEILAYLDRPLLGDFLNNSKFSLTSHFLNLRNNSTLSIYFFNLRNNSTLSMYFFNLRNNSTLSIKFLNLRNISTLSIKFLNLRNNSTLSIYFFNLRNNSTLSIKFFNLRNNSTLSIHFLNLRNNSTLSIYFFNLRNNSTLSIYFFNLRNNSTLSIKFFNLRNNSTLSIYFFNLRNNSTFSIKFFNLRNNSTLSIKFFNLRNNSTLSIKFFNLRNNSTLSIKFFNLRNNSTLSIHFLNLRNNSTLSIYFFNLRNNSTLSIKFFNLRNNSTLSIKFFNLRNNSTLSIKFFNLRNNSTLSIKFFNLRNNSTLSIKFFNLRNNSTLSIHFLNLRNNSTFSINLKLFVNSYV